jgi:hypothetical protein
MTRRKKTRKIGQIGVRKQDARPADTKDKRLKKPAKGQKPGARNSLLVEKAEKTNLGSTSSSKKDPKLGSKKPISLVAETNTVEEKVEPQHIEQPSIKLTKVKQPELAPEKELDQLESDERLIDLVERVEGGELLTGKEAKYFNAKMARHAELLDILGIEQEDEDDPMDRLEADQWDDLLGKE